jgi:hypothetical protein
MRAEDVGVHRVTWTAKDELTIWLAIHFCWIDPGARRCLKRHL